MAARTPSRTLGFAAFGLGVALLSIAVLSPYIVLPPLKTIPLDTGANIVTTSSPGMLLDAAAYSTDTALPEHRNNPECQLGSELPISCFIGHDIPMHTTQEVKATEPNGKKILTLHAETTLVREDVESQSEEGDLVAGSVDTVTLNRFSAEPDAEQPSTFELSNPGAGAEISTGGFSRNGLQYHFPFDTERHSYPFFDTTAHTDHLIDFADAVKEHDITSLQFSQDVGAVNLFNTFSDVLDQDGEISTDERAALDGLRITSPARRWYTAEELAAEGLDPAEEISMSRYYAVIRTVRVEPKTGVIVYGKEQVNHFFARSDDEAQRVAESFFAPDFTPSSQRTALFVTSEWDQGSRDRQWEKAASGHNALKRLEFGIYVMGTLGAGIIIAAMFWLRRKR